MKTILLILIIGIFSAAGFWYITENNRADYARMRAEQRKQREKDELLEQERYERQRAEDERIRKEQAEALAKEDAVRLFLNYINREEDRIKDDIEELKLNLEKVDIDQKSLSDELLAIEEANATRIAYAKKRGEQQRDKVNQVSALLKSQTINRLASTYCGEDFAALRMKFESEMQIIKDVDDKYLAQLKANRKTYDDNVSGINDKANTKLRSARKKYEIANTGIERSKKDIEKLVKEKEKIEKELERLGSHKMHSPWEKRRIDKLRNQHLLIIGQLSQSENISALSAADMAHFEATEAETDARRKYDQEGVRLEVSNNQAHRERMHEREIYETARQFEVASLNKLREAISRRKENYGMALAANEKKLAYLKKSAVNIDFLSKAEIEELRHKVSKSISNGIIVEDEQ